MYLRRSATANLIFRAVVSARTGIHTRNKHKVCGILGGLFHFPVFERLTQSFERVTAVFGHFVKEQNAVICKAHFSGLCLCSATDKRRHSRCVMRSAERTSGHDADVAVEYARNRVYFRHFHRFFKRHFGHNRGHALCKHSLACARRSYHKSVVTARNSNFQSALCNALTFYVRKIHAVAVRYARRLVS